MPPQHVRPITKYAGWREDQWVDPVRPPRKATHAAVHPRQYSAAMGHTAYNHVGLGTPYEYGEGSYVDASDYFKISSGGVGTAIAVAGMAAGAYHGYKRNRSVGWAIAWAILGGLAPIITVPVSVAQGFGKPKKGG